MTRRTIFDAIQDFVYWIEDSTDPKYEIESWQDGENALRVRFKRDTQEAEEYYSNIDLFYYLSERDSDSRQATKGLLVEDETLVQIIDHFLGMTMTSINEDEVVLNLKLVKQYAKNLTIL